jgi:hypothetical protein
MACLKSQRAGKPNRVREETFMYADERIRPLPLETVTLLQEGQVAAAIKSLREAESLDLRQARVRVDAWLAREPLLKAQLELRQRARRRKIFFWFLVIDLAIAAGIIYWLLHRGST